MDVRRHWLFCNQVKDGYRDVYEYENIRISTEFNSDWKKWDHRQSESYEQSMMTSEELFIIQSEVVYGGV